MKNRLGRQILWSIFFFIARYFVRPFLVVSRSFRYKRAKRIEGPAIIIANHNTDIDIGLLGLSYKQPMYVVASEHVFRLGIATTLIRWFFDPIVRMKGKTEIRTVRRILNILKKGGHICLFAEGNRSFNGLTGEITKATASLVKMAKCQMITYRFEGGYLAYPRWAKYPRTGRFSGAEVGRYSPEQLADMTPDEVLDTIRRDLHEDAYERQGENPAVYKGKNLAESIETALYLCPQCHQIGTLHSAGDELSCSCGLKVRFSQTGMLENIGQTKAYFETVTQWDLWQDGKTAELVNQAGDGVICKDEVVSLFQVTPCKSKTLLMTGSLSISKSALLCGSYIFPLTDISDLAIIGRNTLVFETRQSNYYEIRSKTAYNALKYRRFFLYCKNLDRT